MGIVVKISAYETWNSTYLVQTLDEHEAKEKAYAKAVKQFSCDFPSFEEIEQNNCCGVSIEILAYVEQIIF